MSTKHRLYGELKRKRALYLTDTAHTHLVDLAQGNGTSPSEVCEQIIRHHASATAIPVPSAQPAS
ncbi:MAG: hypothetical protein ACO3LH_05620 [Steroidobacteraceae bacterium]